MQRFEPGAAYHHTYNTFILVCVNPAERSFEKCAIDEGQQVLDRLRQQLALSGHSRDTLVVPTGCLMGCKQKGTTVSIIHNQTQTFFHSVTVDDVDTLLASITSSHKPLT